MNIIDLLLVSFVVLAGGVWLGKLAARVSALEKLVDWND